jgi:hypothetical protein
VAGLHHSAAFIIRQAIVNGGLGAEPGAGPPWPVYASAEPGAPDNVLTVFDTGARDLGRTSPDGGRTELPGIQVRVRAGTHEVGYAKADEIALFLDSLYWFPVVVFGVLYLIHAVHRTGGIASLGRDAPTGTRRVFTVNGITDILMS